MRFLAHRGAPKYAPQNTLPSFAFALEAGMREFELDVHMTADCRLVVHHDFTLQQTAGVAVAIKNLSFGELSKYNVAEHFAGAAPQHAPLLSEVMALMAGRVDTLNIEVKNEDGTYPGIEKKLLDEVSSAAGWDGHILYSSFDHDVLGALRALSPSARLGVLVGKVELPRALKTASALKAESMHISLRQAGDAAYASAIIEKGFPILVYTVNDSGVARELSARGIAGVFTDDPAVSGAKLPL